MGVRARIGKGLEATLGKERTDRVRKAERRTRQRLGGQARAAARRARPSRRARRPGCRGAEAGSGRQRSAAW